MVKKVMLAACLFAGVVSAEIKPLMIGETIPAGPLQTVVSEDFNLLDAAKEQHLAVIYYRGGWCPYCNVHLNELNQLYKKLMDLGFRIIAISPDKPEKLLESASKEKLQFTLLSDSTMKTALAFGIAYKVDDPTLKKLASYSIDIENASGQKHHLLPVPSVFLVGTDGKVDFVYANPDYTTRLDPKVLIAAAEAAVKSEKATP